VLAAPPPLVITTTSLPPAVIGGSYSQTLADNGGGTGTGYTWAVTTGSLPSAVNLNGLISNPGTTISTVYFAGTFTQVTSTTLSAAMWVSPEVAWTTGDVGYGVTHIWGTVTVSVAGTLQATVANATPGEDCTVPAGALMIIKPNN
jgi:hypothetical protein